MYLQKQIGKKFDWQKECREISFPEKSELFKDPIFTSYVIEFSHKYTKLAIMPKLASEALLHENKKFQ